MKKIITALLIIFLIFSCVKPPEDTPEVNILSLIHENLQFLNKIKYDKERQNELFKNLTESFKAIISFINGNIIELKSSESVSKDGEFGRTLSGNRFVLTKPLYITSINKDMAVSFDKTVWYLTKNDESKGIHGLENDYNFDTKVIDNKKIIIDYSMSFKLGDNPAVTELKEKREIVTLKKGMKFSSRDEENINFDLEKKVLYIPEAQK